VTDKKYKILVTTNKLTIAVLPHSRESKTWCNPYLAQGGKKNCML